MLHLAPFPEPDQAATALLDPLYAALARELVADIHPASEVLLRYGFAGAGDPAWLAVSATRSFQQLVDVAAREWNALDSTQKRVRAKALASVEVAIPEWHRTMLDPTTGAGLRSDLAKLMVSVANVGAITGPQGTGDGGGGFKLNIVINPPGEAPQTLVVEHKPVLDARAEDVT